MLSTMQPPPVKEFFIIKDKKSMKMFYFEKNINLLKH